MLSQRRRRRSTRRINDKIPSIVIINKIILIPHRRFAIISGTYQKYVIRHIRRGATDGLYHCAVVAGVVQFQSIVAFNTGGC